MVRQVSIQFDSDKRPPVGIVRGQKGPWTMDNDTRKHVSYRTGRDRNGNKIVHCSSREGGFAIQTNGNLPRTHRDGVTVETDAEVRAYVAAHGSERQKRILGI